jgi:HrpA-like RNA helicase
MKHQPIPELQRIPLEEVCLTILAANLATNCMDFLLQAPQPPSNESVTGALKVLEEVNAIEPVRRQSSDARIEIITPLGQHLAKLPVHIRLGKMLIFGSLFKVLDTTLTIAASLSSKSPFSTNIHNSSQAAAAHKAFVHPTSDFLTVCNVWDAYSAACSVSFSNGRRFCEKNFLNRTAFIEISDARKQFVQLLEQIGFINSSDLKSAKDISSSCYNINGSNENVVGAVICAGLYPNCAHVLTQYGDDLPSLWQRQEQLWFHRTSVHHNKKKVDSEWVIYHEKFATHKAFVSTTCLIKPFSILLFGKSIEVQHLERKVLVDGWIELGIPAQTGVMFQVLREAMSKVLNNRISSVGEREDDTLIDGIIKLLILE